ncbi:MAG: DMT family transporter [Planctomycetia bacterium]|nr:DMT family transporter [Planctomycetia bacterium]
MSGFFVKLLTESQSWMGEVRAVAPEQIACWRCLFGALAIAPFLRLRMLQWHPILVITACCFTLMNGLFIAAMSIGGVAEAAWLQYTAPFWVFLVQVIILRRSRASQRDWLALAIAMTGVVIIVFGNLQSDQFASASMALGAGIAFAGVIIGLSLLQHLSSIWLTFVNQLTAGLLALPWAMATPWPEGWQWFILALFGAVQVALPNWLLSKAMYHLPAHEASLITLLDPLLAPFWAYLITYQIPSSTTVAGGIIFLAALILRYLPLRTTTART